MIQNGKQTSERQNKEGLNNYLQHNKSILKSRSEEIGNSLPVQQKDTWIEKRTIEHESWICPPKSLDLNINEAS